MAKADPRLVGGLLIVGAVGVGAFFLLRGLSESLKGAGENLGGAAVAATGIVKDVAEAGEKVSDRIKSPGQHFLNDPRSPDLSATDDPTKSALSISVRNANRETAWRRENDATVEVSDASGNPVARAAVWARFSHKFIGTSGGLGAGRIVGYTDATGRARYSWGAAKILGKGADDLTLWATHAAYNPSVRVRVQ